MLINFSNHPSTKSWPKKQKLAAAEQYGEVIDMPFPQLSVDADLEEVERIADEYLERIVAMKPDAVLIVGEFVFVYQMVQRLLDAGIPTVASRAVRRSREFQFLGFSPKRVSDFKFECFMPYGRPRTPKPAEPPKPLESSENQ